MPADEAFVTLATNDSYALGALVLAHSLREVGTTRQLAILISSGVSEPIRHQLEGVFNSVTYVNVLDSNDSENLQLLTRPDLGVTFTKLHCWRLTQYSKCVFMDADTLVVQNIDDLFEREELSAAPDVGWPDCFNSGVFVYRPSADTYRSLLGFAVSHGSFDGGDQGLLNAYFSDWATKDIRKRLPYVYNVVAQTFYSYKPALKQFGKDVKVIHFIGATKPWHTTYNLSTQSVIGQGEIQHSQEFLQLWWKIFIARVKGSLDVNTIHLSDDLCRLNIYTQQQLSDEHRQYSWERGHVDYLGIDSFENIQKQLDAKLQERQSSGPGPAAQPVAHPPQPAAPQPQPAAPQPQPAVPQPQPAAVPPQPAVVPSQPAAPQPAAPQPIAQPAQPAAVAPRPAEVPKPVAVTPAVTTPPPAAAAPPKAAGPAAPASPQAAGPAKPTLPQAAGPASPTAAGPAKPSSPQAAGPAKPSSPQAAGPASPQAAGPAKPSSPQAAGPAKPSSPQAAGPAKPTSPQAAGQKTSSITIKSSAKPPEKK